MCIRDSYNVCVSSVYYFHVHRNVKLLSGVRRQSANYFFLVLNHEWPSRSPFWSFSVWQARRRRIWQLTSDVSKAFFAAAGPRLWNMLPIYLRLCDGLGQFKLLLKTHLFGVWERCFVTPLLGALCINHLTYLLTCLHHITHDVAYYHVWHALCVSLPQMFVCLSVRPSIARLKDYNFKT